MKYIKTFEQFILESKGISDIVYEFNEKIWVDVKAKILSTTNEKGTKFVLIKIFNNLEDGFKLIYLMVHIHIYINPINPESCDGLSNFTNSEFEDGYLRNPAITLNVFSKDKNYSEKTLREIKSTLLHELVHVYQIYKQGDKSRDSNWQLGSVMPKIRSTLKTKLGGVVIQCLYNSLKHEIAANLHQYFFHKNNNSNHDSLFYIKQSLRNFGEIIPKIETFTPDMIADMELIRSNYIASLEQHKPNDNYIDNVQTEWKTTLDSTNIADFLVFLDNNYFKPALKKIEKKSVMIDKKYNEIRYDDVSEAVIFYEIMNSEDED